MIDLNSEKLLTFHDVRKLRHIFPRRREGKQLDLSTLYRWWKEGLAGVHLEVLSVGASPATSVEALNRFFAAVAAAKQQRAAVVTARRTAAAARGKDRKRRVRENAQHRGIVRRDLVAAGLMTEDPTTAA
ncbi:MAG: DUF1580 domain-containing protein [Gemmataceae bacterium]|nr:DUF1580 domain-containing protein [Gemmataceae bacterium]